MRISKTKQFLEGHVIKEVINRTREVILIRDDGKSLSISANIYSWDLYENGLDFVFKNEDGSPVYPKDTPR
jgi:hypothetical protein